MKRYIFAKYKNYLLWGFLLGCLSILFFLYYYEQPQENTWVSYYKEKLKHHPEDLVIKGLKLFKLEPSQDPVAIDLGAGVGNETALLLKHGFKVIAIDQEHIAIDIIQHRSDIKPYLPNITIIQSHFETLDWNRLPAANMIVASFALPFCERVKFTKVFSQLKKALKPKGFFIGHFFDHSNEQRQEQVSKFKNMTFHNHKEIINLFKGFEILHLKEIKDHDKKPIKDIDGIKHYYEVIAKKQ